MEASGTREGGIAGDPLVGQVLDERYRIVAPLGSGGVGVVYRAEHLRLGRAVALKMLNPEHGGSEALRRRFDREAQALAALAHPYIVSVTDYGMADGKPYLVMELLEGETLQDRLERGHLPPDEATTIARQMLKGLAFAHSRGLLHRDLKPGNIFLRVVPGVGEQVKLLDFGLAKFVSGDASRNGPAVTHAGIVFGTPAYMAPEQATGGETDPRTDVYSAGVVLFEVLAGCRPFTGKGAELMRQHLLAPVPSLSGVRPSLHVDPAFDALIARAMAKERGARFADAAELLDALEQVPEPRLRDQATPEAPHPPRMSRAPTAVALAPVAASPSADARAARPLASTVAHPSPAASPAPAARKGQASNDGADGVARSGPSGPVRRGRMRPLLVGLVALAAMALLGGAVLLLLRFSDSAADEAVAAHRVPDRFRHHRGRSHPHRDSPPGEHLGSPETAHPSPDQASPDGTSPDHATPDHAAPDHATPEAPDDRPATPAPARPPPHDPFAHRPTPPALAALRRRIDAGHDLHDSQLKTLRAYARHHADDPRPLLLLARLYLTRGWRSDAIERYVDADERDPASRGYPPMRADLFAMLSSDRVGTDAAHAIAHIYGPEALPAVDHLLAGHPDHATEARLRHLRARIAP